MISQALRDILVEVLNKDERGFEASPVSTDDEALYVNALDGTNFEVKIEEF